MHYSFGELISYETTHYHQRVVVESFAEVERVTFVSGDCARGELPDNLGATESSPRSRSGSDRRIWFAGLTYRDSDRYVPLGYEVSSESQIWPSSNRYSRDVPVECDEPQTLPLIHRADTILTRKSL